MTICLIDADVVAYMACENRYKNSQGQILVTLEERVFTEEENAAYLSKAWLRFQEIILELCELCFTNDYKAAVKGEGNFRNDIYPEYKSNRHADPKKRNPFVPTLRKMAVDAGMAVAAHGMEADDLLRMWQQECKSKQEPYVICSIDKDLKCIPGRHYLMHKNEFLDVSEAEAVRFYYEQLLKGDPTDNIKGIPKVGDVKAKKYLAGDSTEAQFQYTVSEAYQGYFGNDWEKELLLNGQLIHLKKTVDDTFSLANWNLSPYTPYIPEESPITIVEETPVENKIGTVSPWSQVLGFDNLTEQLTKANDKLEATIANGMTVPPEPEPIQPFKFDLPKKDKETLEIVEEVKVMVNAVAGIPDVPVKENIALHLNIPKVSFTWGKRKAAG